jgi:hypothetical protein
MDSVTERESVTEVEPGKPQSFKPVFYPHFTNGFWETAREAKRCWRVFHSPNRIALHYK